MVVKLITQITRAALWGTFAIAPFLTSVAYAGRQTAEYAATVENFEGFAEGVAAMMMVPQMLSAVRSFKSVNGSLIEEKTFRDRGIELTTLSSEDAKSPGYAALSIARPEFPLPIGVHIGTARSEVESWLGQPHESESDRVAYRRTIPVNEGCSDPMTLIYKNNKLVEVSWLWQFCHD